MSFNLGKGKGVRLLEELRHPHAKAVLRKVTHQEGKKRWLIGVSPKLLVGISFICNVNTTNIFR